MRSRDFYGRLVGFEKVWAVEFSPRGACCSPYSTRKNLAKYRPQGTKIPICREFMRSMLSRVTDREHLVIDRESYVPTAYRPRGNSLFCSSFCSCKGAAVDAVDVFARCLSLWLSTWALVIPTALRGAGYL